eukprot:s361_g4.t1
MCKCQVAKFAVESSAVTADRNLISFNSAISACEKAGRWQEVLCLLQALSGRSQPLPPWDELQLFEAKSCDPMRKGGQWQRALQSLREARDFDSEISIISYSATISACEKSGQWQVALQLLEDAISACEKRGQWRPALLLLNQLVEEELEAELWHGFMQMLLERLHFPSPKQDRQADSVSYNAAIAACEKEPVKSGYAIVISISSCISASQKACRWLLALELLQLAEALEIDGNLVTFNAAMAACAEPSLAPHHQFAAARQQRPAGGGYDLPNVCCDAINECRRTVQWQGAVAWLTWQGSQELRPNIVVHGAVTSACEKSSQWLEAAQQLASVVKVGLRRDVVLQNNVMNAGQKGLMGLDGTKSLFSCTAWPISLATLGTLPITSLEPSVITVSTGIAAMARSSRWRGAVQTLALTASNEVAYGAALSACEAKSQWKEAATLLETIDLRALQTNLIISNTAISSFSWHLAVLALRDASEERLADEISYNAAISACEKSGQWQWALELLSQALGARLISEVGYSAAASACEKSEKWQWALWLMTEAQQSKLQLDVIFCSAVISACQKCEEWPRALMMFHELSSLPCDLVAYNAAIAAWETGNQWPEAFGLLQEIETQTLQPDVISHCSALACRGAWPSALARLERLQASQASQAVLNAVAGSCEKGGEWQIAVQLLDQGHEDIISYNIAMGAWHQGEHWPEVLALLAELEATLARPNVISYSVAIGAAQLAGRWLWSMELLRKLHLGGHVANVITYNAVMCACLEGGQWQMAVSLYQSSKQPDAISSSIATSAYLLAGRYLEAVAALAQKVKQILGAEKSPQIAGDVHHEYEDKYLLVERATNMAAAAELNCLGMLGLTPQHLSTLKQWASGDRDPMGR